MTWQKLIEEWNSKSDMIECQSSGSTGTPKLIRIPKSQMTASARRTLSFFNLNSSSHFHSCLSPDYIGGKMMLIRALTVRGTFTWEVPSNRPLSGVTDKIDLLCVVPSQMIHILDNIDYLPDIGNILIGGSPIPDDLRLRISDSRLKCWETYGMTETASHIAIRKVETDPGLFYPLNGIRVSTIEDSLVIDIDGWQRFYTNDIATVDYATGGFRIMGRKDNVIITGGLKVQPEDVERRLVKVLGSEVMISGEPDSKWGNKIVLWIDNTHITDEEILNICRILLKPFEVPKKIIHSPIPKTNNGKIKRL